MAYNNANNPNAQYQQELEVPTFNKKEIQAIAVEGVKSAIESGELPVEEFDKYKIVFKWAGKNDGTDAYILEYQILFNKSKEKVFDAFSKFLSKFLSSQSGETITITNVNELKNLLETAYPSIDAQLFAVGLVIYLQDIVKIAFIGGGNVADVWFSQPYGVNVDTSSILQNIAGCDEHELQITDGNDWVVD